MIGSRIGETGRLQQNPAKRRGFALVAAHQKPSERRLQVAAQRAADTAAGHDRHLALDRLDQQVVDADLAPFVNDYRAVGHVGVAEQAVQQGGLATAEKTGDDGDRKPAR